MKQISILLTILFYTCLGLRGQQPITSSGTMQKQNIIQSKFTLLASNNCNQTNLSNQFDLSIDYKRYSDTIDLQDSSVLIVDVKDKETKSTIDQFTITSSFYYSFMFLSCDSMTSYTTNFKADREIADNYFGDIVIADLNFDGYDDIAVVNDSGGNGGPHYNFYIQTNNRKFIMDKFLTESVVFFPSTISSKNKTLTTLVHAGVCGLGENIYVYDKNKNMWTEKSHRRINICDEE